MKNRVVFFRRQVISLKVSMAIISNRKWLKFDARGYGWIWFAAGAAARRVMLDIWIRGMVMALVSRTTIRTLQPEKARTSFVISSMDCGGENGFSSWLKRLYEYIYSTSATLAKTNRWPLQAASFAENQNYHLSLALIKLAARTKLMRCTAKDDFKNDTRS